MTRVMIEPFFRGEDKGDGGIRRVVDAQRRWLPHYGVAVVGTLEEADVVALHAGTWVETPKPIAAHCHGLYWSGYSWAKWAHALNKDVIRTMKQSDAITAPSEWVAQALRRGMWRDVEVMHHGIEPGDWPEHRSERGQYVLWNKSRVDAVCDPTPVNELAKLAVDVPFMTTFGEKSTNVEVTGLKPYLEAVELVRNAAVYLATSRETFGIGTLEAMAAGVPILAWDWGGQHEFVQHRKHGWLAEEGDYDGLLEGLRYCVKHRDELGQAAREYVLTHYTWQQRIEPYAELYKRLARETAAPPRVTVVITNYNLGKYLPSAVESVKKASAGHDDVQIIVVDDASTEPLPESVTSDNEIAVLRNEENLYLAEALNRGVRSNVGRYVIPLDADNMLAPESITALADALDKDRSLDIAYGKMLSVPENDPGAAFVSDWPPAEANLDEQLRHRNQISSTAMYRRTVWNTVGGYRRRCHTAEDADFWTRALSLGFTGRRVTDAVTLIYRDRKDSMSHVQQDWSWHEWYRWAGNPETRSFAAGGEYIPTHEFPIISVIIPVGQGHERLVLDALDSLQNQTFRRWEAVVVNDSEQVLEDLPSWARVVYPVGGHSASAARNAGLKVAKGQLVVFLDADDWLHPDALDRMFAAHNEVGGFIYGDFFAVDRNGAQRKRAPEFDANDVLKQLPYPVTCLYSKSDLLKNNIWFDESEAFVKGWEDWDFTLQAVAKAGLCGSRIPSPLFYYRVTTGTLRLQAYADQDNMKQVVFDKWGDYITGKKENAAVARGCGCGGGSFALPASTGVNGAVAPTGQADPQFGEVVALEYVAQEQGSRTFVGRVTGNRYRFGNDPVHKERNVYKPDVDWLLTLGLFRKVDRGAGGVGGAEETPRALVAAGPPGR